jgi:hypothetical protein
MAALRHLTSRLSAARAVCRGQPPGAAVIIAGFTGTRFCAA